MLKRSIFFSTLLLILQSLATGQVSSGGLPAGLTAEDIEERIPYLGLKAPELTGERTMPVDKPGIPMHAGIAVKAGIDLMALAKRDISKDHLEIYRLGISVPGAEALGVYFDEFYIPRGGRLFVYDTTGTHVLGAFTEKNNHPTGTMALSLVPGDKIILEYNKTEKGSLPRLHIEEVAYHFLPLTKSPGEEYGLADFCEVNINCSPEGDEWQDEKRGIARIYVKEGGSFFWCTGSLVNNARRDRTPYFLTANHCGEFASTQDYQSWVFYFNFESEECENPVANPALKSVTGASLLASYDSDGSDFKLLLLDDELPDEYNPYFNGWSLNESPVSQGVSIHHPSGDIKKISTFNTTLTSVSWSGAPGTHWQVRWSDTPNGHGVTEGGSSGAPLFNAEGQIVGTLTGGLAACEEGGSGPGSGPDEPDYYGKFSYSWAANGNSPAQRLSDWLDPEDTGIEELRGINNFLQADFEASELTILTGSVIEFSDLSSGLPTYYKWHFEGGEPAIYEGPGPVNVLYPGAGTYDVTMIVSDEETTDTLIRQDYISVVGQLYPNPSNTMINVYVGDIPPDFIVAEIIDLSGRRLYEEKIKGNTSSVLGFDVSYLPAGMYVVRLAMNQRFHMYKFIVPPSF